MKLVEINKFERKLRRQQINDPGHSDACNVFAKYRAYKLLLQSGKIKILFF